jgi:hypothetical protein
MERKELQNALGEVVVDKMAALGVLMDQDHTRRFMRVCFRMAARVCIRHKVPPPVFIQMAMGAFADEMKAEEPSLVPPELKAEGGMLN